MIGGQKHGNYNKKAVHLRFLFVNLMIANQTPFRHVK